VVIDADLAPWVRINFHDSKTAAEAAGYSMITETQWLAIAYNASQQAANWTGGEVGVGKLCQGIRKGNVSGAQRGSYKSTDSDEHRWLVLSNGSRVCDFNGNIFQWVSDDVQGDEDGLIGSEIGLDSISLSTAPYPADTHGMGWRPSSSRDWSGRALLRGGGWNSDGSAGAFYLGGYWPGSGDDYVGFRCTVPSSGL
jgi:formylglycine-generating enzyme required for sulfatase activity